jgi:ferredoxin
MTTTDCRECGSNATRNGRCEFCGECVAQSPVDAIRDRYHEALTQRDRMTVRARKRAEAGAILDALEAEKLAARFAARADAFSIALDLLREAEPSREALLDLADDVAAGNTDADDLAAAAEALLKGSADPCST